MYPIDRIRQDFPFLRQPAAQGLPLAYLDNAATTQKPQSVIDALTQVYSQGYANVHRGVYGLAERTTAAFEAARLTLQQFVGAARAEEIIFTHGCTAGINAVAFGWLAPRLQPGDEVLVTAMEHHANFVPWQVVCQQKGAKLRVLPFSERGELSLDQLAAHLNARTKLLAISHISNSLGTINPIASIVDLAKAQGVPVLVDAAQAMLTHPLPVADLGCDFLVFSGHKLLGPTGVGVLYGRYEQLAQADPFIYGGEMIRQVSHAMTTFAPPPQRWEAGTPPIAGVIALAAAVRYVQQIGPAAIAQHTAQLRIQAEAGLRQLPGLRLVGEAAAKGAIVSFTTHQVHPHDMATLLDQWGIAVRAGQHCAQPALQQLGLQATTRASFSLYNTSAEVERLVQGVARALQLLS